jgi:hypothetical protein
VASLFLGNKAWMKTKTCTEHLTLSKAKGDIKYLVFDFFAPGSTFSSTNSLLNHIFFQNSRNRAGSTWLSKYIEIHREI